MLELEFVSMFMLQTYDNLFKILSYEQMGSQMNATDTFNVE